ETGNYAGPWGPYRALCDLRDGAQIPPPEINEEERNRLRRELDELTSRPGTSPNILVLEKWLSLPVEISDPLRIEWSLSAASQSAASILRSSSDRPEHISAFESGIRKALFWSQDAQEIVRFIRLSEVNDAAREALVRVVRSATEKDGLHFCQHFGE